MEDELFGEPRLSLLKASQHSTLYRTCATASLIFARLRAHNKMQNAWQIGAKRMANVRYWPKADIDCFTANVRFRDESRH
jgi:hypothetical protein